MTARDGGEAAKFGERYEGRWTVRRLLDVLRGSAMSITIEDDAVLAEGVEFTLRRSDGGVEVHQVKRQNRIATSWTLNALRDAGVLDAMALHADAGRDFRFVSTTPTPRLRRLSDRARRSDDLAGFFRVQLDGDDIRRDFARLEHADAWASAEHAWRTLRRIDVAWPDERELSAVNATLAETCLSGAEPSLMAVGLGELILDSTGVRLDAPAVHARLPAHGLKPSALADRPALAAAVAATRKRWTRTVRPWFLQPEISRCETSEILARLDDDVGRHVLVAGTAGSGKSGVLHQVVERVAARNWPIMAAARGPAGTVHDTDAARSSA